MAKNLVKAREGGAEREVIEESTAAAHRLWCLLDCASAGTS